MKLIEKAVYAYLALFLEQHILIRVAVSVAIALVLTIVYGDNIVGQGFVFMFCVAGPLMLTPTMANRSLVLSETTVLVSMIIMVALFAGMILVMVFPADNLIKWIDPPMIVLVLMVYAPFYSKLLISLFGYEAVEEEVDQELEDQSAIKMET